MAKNSTMMMLENMNGVEKATKRTEEAPLVEGHPELVDQWYEAKYAYEEAKLDLDIAAKSVDMAARGTYNQRARNGAFVKSVDLKGTKTTVKVSYPDNFKEIPVDDDLKKSAGGSFDKYFRQIRKIELKKTDDQTVEELITALGPDKFQEIFKVKLSYKPKKGFDKEQFNAPKTVCDLAKQYAPSIKEK